MRCDTLVEQDLDAVITTEIAFTAVFYESVWESTGIVKNIVAS